MTELSTEYHRLAAVSMGTELKPFRDSLAQVNNGLKNLGLITDDQYKAVTMITGALNIMAGMAGIAKLAQAWRERKNAADTVKGAALTAAKTAEVGIGWGEIAAATIATAAVGVILYGAINTIKLGPYNLGTAEGQNEANAAVQGVIA